MIIKYLSNRAVNLSPDFANCVSFLQKLVSCRRKLQKSECNAHYGGGREGE